MNYSGSNSPNGPKGSGIFLPYTWNDDSMKFLGDRNIGAPPVLAHAQMCRQVLRDIYPAVDLDEHQTANKGEVEINWEDEALYLGAFKMNLPGKYGYQRRLFSQFMDGIEAGNPNLKLDRFVLAGDDVSWPGGWVEGAVTTAINAVNKMAVVFGGGFIEWNPGPIDQ